jgi:hypothetical protein
LSAFSHLRQLSLYFKNIAKFYFKSCQVSFQSFFYNMSSSKALQSLHFLRWLRIFSFSFRLRDPPFLNRQMFVRYPDALRIFLS